MAKSLVLVFLCIVAICNLEFSAAKTQKMTSVGYDKGRPVETACHGGDISFQTDSDVGGMYVGVPTPLFENKNGGNNCGKKIKVSCVGGKPKCKNSKPVQLTIIDTLDGDFIEISNKAFNTISDFDIGIIDVKVTN
ncbi:hypothetical protein Mapa_001245 [Marchantia paleacea]|nr:hypothetical protein Mapa_001240 [Marchantia paleacea]KAG6557317.1 hypothetical protein Mapa_001245 [Marchantia paleacea]